MSTVKALVDKISLFYRELAKPFVGREEEALVITLSLMTAEHVVLIGEPGTAKSALARRAADLLQARFFKYLLTRYTEPDELLGPLDIAALKKGKYVRITRGKLPEAEIAFLDEVFNASSAILNTLLTLMNERIIYDGYNEIPVPLWTLIGASNAIPEEQEYQALYDRFLHRHFVKPVSEDKWSSLLEHAWRIEKEGYRAPAPVLTLEELKEINRAVLSVDVSTVVQRLVKLYAVLEDQGLHLTDRRKGKALKTIAAHSLLHGRTAAVEEDLVVLKYIAPRDYEEAEKVSVILMEELFSREKLLEELREIENNIREVKAYLLRTREFHPRLLEYLRGLEKAQEKLKKIASSVTDDYVRMKAQNLIVEIGVVIDDLKSRLAI
ncbi:MAG: AAA family ATPase [Desulfurococcaceae archaeon]